jgi:hypothetical protein
MQFKHHTMATVVLATFALHGCGQATRPSADGGRSSADAEHGINATGASAAPVTTRSGAPAAAPVTSQARGASTERGASSSGKDDDADPTDSRSPAQTPNQRPSLQNLAPVPNTTGVARTYSTSGAIDLTGDFFTSFGTNGRTCGSCHDPRAGMSVTPKLAQERFEATAGLDPLFRPVDGSVSPASDVSTVAARRQAYALVLSKGLIRIGRPIPAGAEFELVAVDDPYRHADAQDLSLFRRPLPATNLPFLATVMWDGRESAPGLDLTTALGNQAVNATLTHAQGQGLTAAQRSSIVAFELSLFTTQSYDDAAGDLVSAPALGGAVALSTQPFVLGGNVPGPPAPGAKPFDPNVFQLFGSWSTSPIAARASVARGEQIFNTRAFDISGVRGVNDVAGLPVVPATCSTCHNAANVGGSTNFAFFDIGISDGGARRTPDLPLYTLRRTSTGETVTTTDPGRALITGKWSDLDTFKVPGLRGLAAHAPYFHNGTAPSLDAVVAFYDQRFQINLSPTEQADLIAFLRAL